MYYIAKKRTFEILENINEYGRWGKIFYISIFALIILNVFAVIFESVNSLESRYGYYFHLFEMFSVLIFTIEYLLRIWVCTTVPKYKHNVFGRIRFIFSFFAVIDLLAVLPFYLPMFLPVDLRFLRVLRLMRIFKLGRYSQSFDILMRVFKAKKRELLITFFILIVLLIISSSLMYYAENKIQPENYSNIPSAMWWSVSTLTTVGYGDIYPVTLIGKLLASIIAILGVGMFALPTGILGSAFIDELQKKEKGVCPHCGKKF